MKNKIYSLLLLGAVSLSSYTAKAQCTGGRFLDTTTFASYTMSTVAYDTAGALMMDIYQPTGDTLSKRPIIIFAHEGSFTGGSRSSDPTIMNLTYRFVKRGYVVASIDYRLASSPFDMIDSATALNVVAKAISDGKAAIRYFVKDAATTNTYKIDTGKIFIGGNSAGAVLYMNVGYISSLAECPTYLQTVFNANGGFEGNSGNAGYETKFKAIIDLAGGLNSTSFVSVGDAPSVNVQGDLDDVVPYTCAHALQTLCPVTLCGLGSLEPAYVANNIPHASHVFAGAKHVPWDSVAYNVVDKFNLIDTFVTNFLYDYACSGTTYINQLTASAHVSLYPNPATDAINIESSQSVSEICVFDATGRMVQCIQGMNNKTQKINTSTLSKGIYFVKLNFDNNNDFSPVVKKFVVE